MPLPVSLRDVEAASDRLRAVANATPIHTSRTLDARVGARVLLKAESFQRAGAFKFRGAYNAISSLSPEERRRGVVTFSSGNHGQGVALAASLLMIPATIVMPGDAQPAKVAATRGYGAEVVSSREITTGGRMGVAEQIVADRGAVMIPPYDDPRIVAGQGTVGLEMMRAHPDLDAVLVPVGGGGLVSGIAIAVKALRPEALVIGVEPELANGMTLSLQSGRVETVADSQTIADGLRPSAPGRLNLEICAQLVDQMVCVSEEEIAEATLWCLQRLKLYVEPSGATALAALLSGRVALAGKNVGVVLSGGNMDFSLLRRVIELASGRPVFAA